MASMREKLSKRRKLAERRIELRSKLDAALLDKNDPNLVAMLDAELQAVERAEHRLAQPHRHATIFLWLSTTFLVVGLIGLGLSFTVSEANFRLQAQVWALTIKAASTGAYGLEERPALSSFTAFDVSSLSVLSGGATTEDLLPVERVEEVLIVKDTRFELVVTGEECLLIRILGTSQTDTGAEITMGVSSEAQSKRAPVAPRQLKPGDYAEFCGAESTDPFLLGSVDEVRLTRLYRDDAPRLEASTVVEGSLLLTDVGEARELMSTDRLVLEGMRSTNLVVRRTDGVLAITLEGRVVDPKIFSAAPAIIGDDLLPNLLTYATKSPPALLLAMAIGLFGTIWNGLKLLKTWWRQ